MPIIDYINQLKSGNKETLRILMSSGFDMNHIDELINIPAHELKSFEKCVELKINGGLLNIEMQKIKIERENQIKIKIIICAGASYNLVSELFGLSKNEISSIKNRCRVKNIESRCSEKEKDIIFDLFNNSKRCKIDNLIYIYDELKLKTNKNISINVINKECYE